MVAFVYRPTVTLKLGNSLKLAFAIRLMNRTECYSANVGAFAGGVIYALTYMPYLSISNDLDTIFKLIACLLSNVAMASGWNLVGIWEGKGSKFFFLLYLR